MASKDLRSAPGPDMPHSDLSRAPTVSSPARRYKRPGRRLWYRDYFIDHPGYAEPDNRDAFAGQGKRPDKVKLFCAVCLEKEVSDLSETMDREASLSLRE